MLSFSAATGSCNREGVKRPLLFTISIAYLGNE
jgi:hypothetical protein